VLPSFHPAPESQPVLPALLRRLLLKGAQAEALALAKRHEAGPHFARWAFGPLAQAGKGAGVAWALAAAAWDRCHHTMQTSHS
jgi:hypothetical protein